MKSKKLISAILAAVSIAGGVVGAQAQSIDGLDHKVDTVINKLQDQENKIQGLENKVNSIDTTRQVEAEAAARKDADTKLQTQIDTNKQQISKNQQNIDKNSSDIKTIQDNWKDSNRAFNLDQVNKIDTNKANIELIHDRMDMGAYKDGTFITNGDSIGEALKKLDTNAVDQQKQIDKNGIKADTAL